MMSKICVWCSNNYFIAKNDNENQVSATICQACLKKEFPKEFDKEIKK